MEKVKGVKPSVSIKDQGTVNYSQPKKIANGGKPGKYGAGNSKGGGAALSRTREEVAQGLNEGLVGADHEQGSMGKINHP